MLIEETNLSTRTKNALLRGGYFTMEDVIIAPPHELSRLMEFGVKAEKEVAQWAKDNGMVAGIERRRLVQTLAEMEKRHAILSRDIETLRAKLAV